MGRLRICRRPLTVTHTRRNFTKATQRAAHARSNGICECHRVWQLPTYKTGCGVKLSPGNIFYEHIEPDRLGGLNDLDNCAALSKTCWKIKTSGFDRPKIDKSKRQQDRARGIQTRGWFPGGRDDRLKKTMRGEVVLRSTGESAWKGRM